MERREVFQAIDDGRLGEIVDNTNSTEELNLVHNALFHRSLEVGVPRQELIRRIDEASYVAARDSLLDERDIRQMSRKTLEDYDPNLAIRVYKTQINAMYKSFEEARASQKAGEDKPEEDLFNSGAYGQMLATSALDGTPAVAVFTSLARIIDDKVEFDRIGQDEAYSNLKENPRAVFTAIGPSNDPTKKDFVMIHVELEEDHSEGDIMDAARARIGNDAVTNVMIFSIKERKLIHLPKSKWD